jgi:hypothetical protein
MKLITLFFPVCILISACSRPVVGTATLPITYDPIISPSVTLPLMATLPQSSPTVSTSTPEMSITPQADGYSFVVSNVEGLLLAIDSANDEINHPGPNTILLRAEIFSLSDAPTQSGEDGLTGLPSITSPITIIGNGAIIERAFDTSKAFRIFHIAETGQLELNGITIRGGSASDFPGGGALLNRGRVNIKNCRVYGNNNSALLNFNGTMRIINTTISQNQGVLGGGIFNHNSSHSSGEGLTIINSTITENTAGSGGGIYNFVGQIYLTNTIVGGNIGDTGSGDCAGNPIQSNGHNLDSDGSCNLTATGDIPKTEPLIYQKETDGNNPSTYFISPESPAVDAGDDRICPPEDQLGKPRPVGEHCDIGAIEFLP